MGSAETLIVSLKTASSHEERLLGGKAVGLGRLVEAGYSVPRGFCITAEAYEQFVRHNAIETAIGMELERKPFSSMRWEEVWDAAMRIRSAFLAGEVPTDVATAIGDAHARLNPESMVVRSSAPGEDSAQRSYAGLHESLVGVVGREALIDAVLVVWASLWSDAALLYRQELGLNPHESRMAVVVQELVRSDVSGVGFGLDPRAPERDREVIEAVPGLCEDLVSGAVDPDRWIMKRSSGEIVEWKPGRRGSSDATPILERGDLALLHRTLHSVEALMGWPADVEWTGKSSALTLLQARPVTKPVETKDDDRKWYLSLRPGKSRLDALCKRVTEELIPELQQEAARFAAENIESCDDEQLASAIEARHEALKRWKQIYWDEFIPLAHGVRQLGLYYNDAVRPEDPYEFVELLKNRPMIASERNAALKRMAALLAKHAEVRGTIERIIRQNRIDLRERWDQHSAPLQRDAEGRRFLDAFQSFLDTYMDITFNGESLENRPDLIVRILLGMSEEWNDTAPSENNDHTSSLEAKLLDRVGPDRKQEARDILRVARLSWQLRDDDNILIGRLENQLSRSLNLAAKRLQEGERLDASSRVELGAALVIAKALRDPRKGTVTLPASETKRERIVTRPGETPRQMIGQPAAPGIASGLVRIVRRADDLAGFRRGEVLVCDAIQPTMTHLLPLAGAVIERRGGMLIHGAIIARELGIPCVNGVPDAAEVLSDGDLVTVDGYLGIVAVGSPEFEMELGAPGSRSVPSTEPG